MYKHDNQCCRNVYIKSTNFLNFIFHFNRSSEIFIFISVQLFSFLFLTVPSSQSFFCNYGKRYCGEGIIYFLINMLPIFLGSIWKEFSHLNRPGRFNRVYCICHLFCYYNRKTAMRLRQRPYCRPTEP